MRVYIDIVRFISITIQFDNRLKSQVDFSTVRWEHTSHGIVLNISHTNVNCHFHHRY